MFLLLCLLLVTQLLCVCAFLDLIMCALVQLLNKVSHSLVVRRSLCEVSQFQILLLLEPPRPVECLKLGFVDARIFIMIELELKIVLFWGSLRLYGHLLLVIDSLVAI